MIKVSVLYPYTEGARFDTDYYVNQHLAMIKNLVGTALQKMELEEGVSGGMPGSKPVYQAAVHMYFETTDAFFQSFGPHASKIVKDVANYTDIRPLTQIGSVRSL